MAFAYLQKALLTDMQIPQLEY